MHEEHSVQYLKAQITELQCRQKSLTGHFAKMCERLATAEAKLKDMDKRVLSPNILTRFESQGWKIANGENVIESKAKPQSLSELQSLCHASAEAAGWWKEFRGMPEKYTKHWIAAKIALVHSEVSEALEAFRKDARDDHLPHRLGVEVEFADAIIRMLDLAGGLGLDIEGAIREKLAYNANRQDHKPETRAAKGGKSF